MLSNRMLMTGNGGKTVVIKGWAGGGASGDGLGGAGGAFVWSGSLPVGTVLTAKVGQGGASGNGRGGGGRTQVSWTGNTLIAGAGGGGAGGAGGAGGGATGQNAPSGGFGGTQSAGGVPNGAPLQGGDGAAGDMGTRAWPNGGAGSAIALGVYHGGGGDGYFGGGGGNGAGGGSGRNGTTTGTATLYAGSGTDPGNMGDPDWAGAGACGASNGQPGGNGRIVIYVEGVRVATLTFTGADQTYTIT